LLLVGRRKVQRLARCCASPVGTVTFHGSQCLHQGLLQPWPSFVFLMDYRPLVPRIFIWPSDDQDQVLHFNPFHWRRRPDLPSAAHHTTLRASLVYSRPADFLHPDSLLSSLVFMVIGPLASDGHRLMAPADCTT
jgi:hypothetical protein